MADCMFVEARSYLSWADHKLLIECIGHDLLAREPKTPLTDFSEEGIRAVTFRNREETTTCGCNLPWKGKQSGTDGA